MIRCITIFLASAFACYAAETSQERKWASPAEVERISVAIDLADFPIPQGKIRATLGLPMGAALWGSSMPSGAPFWIWALSDPDDHRGYYAMRVVYRSYPKEEKLPEPEDLEITSAEVLYIEKQGMQFVIDPQSSIKKHIPAMRKLMKEANQGPADFSKKWCDSMKELKEPNTERSDSP